MSPNVDVPKVTAPPPPPTVDKARQDAEAADLGRKRKGRAATFVSDPLSRGTGGVATAMLQSGQKQMMGQGA